MEIRNIFMKQTMITPDQPVVLQKGETYDAVIKEKKGDEAVVHLKGTDVRVRAEGEWPQAGRVTIKIVAEQEGVPVARIVPRPPQEMNEQAARFSTAEPLSTELRQVEAWLQKHGQSFTKETVSTLQTFFTEAPGTIEQKLETVRIVINKKLELTSTHLVAVHEALHGKPLGVQFAEIANRLDPDFTLAKREEQNATKELSKNPIVAAGRFERQAGWAEKAPTNQAAVLLQQVREQAAREPNLSKAVEYVRQQVVHAPNVERNAADEVDRALRETIRRAIKSLQQEPRLEKALDAVAADIAEAFRAHPHWEQAWSDSLASARTLMEKGRELAARQTVLKTLNEIEASLPSVSTDRPLDVDTLFDGPWQAALSLESKNFLVQTVTKKMAQAALDFKTVKRDVMRQLETVAQLTENNNPAARLQAASMLEMAIKQLDNTILKSDIMLFTDMTTEKQLMKASSALAEAKKRLRQGNVSEARKMVNEVKNMLANLVFKPSEARVKHFVRMQGETTVDPSRAFLEQMNQVMQPPADGPSARHVFDTIRRLGLTHEHEAAEWLVLKGSQEESASPNMKEVLLRLAQSGNESVARQAEQALTNLTGQQLLNKWDGTAGWQSFFFTLPLLWQNEVQNVNVYVNARQHGERIDWENCQLYFLLETRKLGDLGILLHANERNLSITLRNDRDDFAEKAKPFIDMAKEKLEEIGYRVTAVNVAKLTNDAQRKDEQPSSAPSASPYRQFAERGYDVTI